MVCMKCMKGAMLKLDRRTAAFQVVRLEKMGAREKEA
jgi:hypothetical protein